MGPRCRLVWAALPSPVGRAAVSCDSQQVDPVPDHPRPHLPWLPGARLPPCSVRRRGTRGGLSRRRLTSVSVRILSALGASTEACPVARGRCTACERRRRDCRRTEWSMHGACGSRWGLFPSLSRESELGSVSPPRVLAAAVASSRPSHAQCCSSPGPPSMAAHRRRGGRRMTMVRTDQGSAGADACGQRSIYGPEKLRPGLLRALGATDEARPRDTAAHEEGTEASRGGEPLGRCGGELAGGRCGYPRRCSSAVVPRRCSSAVVPRRCSSAVVAVEADGGSIERVRRRLFAREARAAALACSAQRDRASSAKQPRRVRERRRQQGPRLVSEAAVEDGLCWTTCSTAIKEKESWFVASGAGRD